MKKGGLAKRFVGLIHLDSITAFGQVVSTSMSYSKSNIA